METDTQFVPLTLPGETFQISRKSRVEKWYSVCVAPLQVTTTRPVVSMLCWLEYVQWVLGFTFQVTLLRSKQFVNQCTVYRVDKDTLVAAPDENRSPDYKSAASTLLTERDIRDTSQVRQSKNVLEQMYIKRWIIGSPSSTLNDAWIII
jgi:hypothetical protein